MDKTLINSEYVKPFQIKIKTRIRKKLLQMISVLIPNCNNSIYYLSIE